MDPNDHVTSRVEIEIDPCTTVEGDIKLCLEHDLWITVLSNKDASPIFKCRLILECEKHNATPALQVYSDIPITIEKYAADI